MKTIENLGFEQQLDLFETRGMIVNDRDKAIEKIKNIGYYKIKGFSYALCKTEIRNYEDVSFEGVSFDDVVTRYYQDKNLRIYLLHALEKIEVSVKTKMAYVLGSKYGPFGYANFSKWTDRNKHTDSSRREIEKEFCESVKSKINKSNVIDLKFKNNFQNGMPTIWLLMDILTFGDMVFLLKLMTRSNVLEISSMYDLNYDEFVSWLSCLNFIRNVCAHNSNVVDLKLRTKPIIKESWKNNLFLFESNGRFTNRIAVPILIIRHLTLKINPSYRFVSITNSLNNLIKQDDIKAQKLGFKDVKSFSLIIPSTRNKRRNNKKITR